MAYGVVLHTYRSLDLHHSIAASLELLTLGGISNAGILSQSDAGDGCERDKELHIIG